MTLFHAVLLQRRWLVVAVLSGLVFSSGLAFSAQAEGKRRPPRGALALPSSSLKRVHGVTCGKVRGRWTSGRMVSSGYFLSDARRARNYAVLARHTKGAARRANLRRAKAYARRAKKLRRVCAPAAASP